MNFLDVLVLVLVVAAAVGSYRLGLVTRMISWVFMGVGLVIALRLLPTTLRWFEGADPVQLLIVSVTVLLVGSFTGQAIGLLLGERLGVAIPEGKAKTADQVAGAVAGAAVTVILVWLILPVMAGTPGWPSTQARSSAIGSLLERTLPPAPDTVETVQALIGEDDFPQVFDALRPTPDLGPPPGDTGLAQQQLADLAASSVRIEGTACGRILSGSGFVAAPQRVVTNAHVVAGEDVTQVRTIDGSHLDATVVHFDADRDLAVLAVPDLALGPLPIGDADPGAQGGVFGYPGGGDLRVAPFEIARELTATGRDIYNDALTTRSVFELASGLERGDSGAALVDTDGDVVGVAFAIAPDREDVAYALTSDELRTALDEAGSAEVDTGVCLR